jgi:hypothetical protein
MKLFFSCKIDYLDLRINNLLFYDTQNKKEYNFNDTIVYPLFIKSEGFTVIIDEVVKSVIVELFITPHKLLLFMQLVAVLFPLLEGYNLNNSTPFNKTTQEPSSHNTGQTLGKVVYSKIIAMLYVPELFTLN